MDKKPFVTKEQLESITKKYPTPFYLYDEKGIRENAERLKKAFAWNPGYREFCREGYAESLSFADFEGGGLRS